MSVSKFAPFVLATIGLLDAAEARPMFCPFSDGLVRIEFSDDMKSVSLWHSLWTGLGTRTYEVIVGPWSDNKSATAYHFIEFRPESGYLYRYEWKELGEDGGAGMLKNWRTEKSTGRQWDGFGYCAWVDEGADYTVQRLREG